MAVKASVNTQNQTTVRVGQQNAIRVSSTAAGISGADTATTAVNVVGGRADVTQLAVSGLSTFTGIVTTASDLYVGGDLYLTDDLVLDNISGSSLDISGISSVGFLTATDVHVSGVVTATTFDGSLATSNLSGTISNSQLDNNSVSYGGILVNLGSSDDTPAFNLSDATGYPYTSLTGIVTHIVGDTTPQLGGDLDGNSKNILGINSVTATSFYGDGTNLTGIAVTGGDNTFTNINVTGITTTSTLKIGIAITASGDSLFTNQLSVSGLSTYIGIATYKDNVFIDGTLTAGAIDGGTY